MNSKEKKPAARPFGMAYLEAVEDLTLRVASGVRAGGVIPHTGPTSAPTGTRLDCD